MCSHYLIGVPVTMLAMVIVFRWENESVEESSGGLILFWSIVWPITVPLAMLYYLNVFINFAVNTRWRSATSDRPSIVNACQRCATSLPKKGRFCRHCGLRLDRRHEKLNTAHGHSERRIYWATDLRDRRQHNQRGAVRTSLGSYHNRPHFWGRNH